MLTRHEIARRFLVWQTRYEKQCIASPALDLVRAFEAHLQEVYRELTLDDIGYAVKDFFKTAPSLWEWYGTLLDDAVIEIEFFDGQPRIAQKSIASWRHVTEHIDPDALITLALVRRGQGRLVTRLHNWGTLALSADWDLENLLRRGLADTHVHLEGCEPVPLLWQRVMDRKIRLETLRLYQESKDYSLGSRGADFQHQLATIKNAQNHRRDLIKALPMQPVSFQDQEKLSEGLSKGELLQERMFLADAWQAVRSGGKTAFDVRCFDQYLYAKNLFLATHQQGSGTNPGLKQFRIYFDRSKQRTPDKSKRLQWMKITRLLDYLLESPHLRHQNLRISPFNYLEGYIRFFKLWDDRRKDNKESFWKKDVKLGFVIHFIRRPQSRDVREEVIPYERLRREIARQSAVLHLFRRKYPALAKYIVGIDVANLERDCPPEIFTPYLRLLRGDVEIRRDLHRNNPFCEAWHRLAERGEAAHPVDLPQMGLSYHAGEDFYHPIDGMRNMDAVVRGGKMRSGDRIGHGLAAGWDLARFDETRGPSLQIPKGELFDNLVWIHHRLTEIGSRDIKALRIIEVRIRKLGREIYKEQLDLDTLHNLLMWRHRMPPHRPSHGYLDPEQRIWEKELFDPKCRAERRERVRSLESFRDLSETLVGVQKHFVEELAAKRIVIELNPSSNLATSAIRNLAKHPFFNYYNILGDKLNVSLNTDDPGVFATRIELEYELMLHAMTSSGFDTEAAIDLLEKVRHTGMESVFSHA